MNQSASTPSDRLLDAAGTPQDAPLDQPAHRPVEPTPGPVAGAPYGVAPQAPVRSTWSAFPALMAGIPMLALGLFLLTHRWEFFLLIPFSGMIARGGGCSRR